MAATSQSQSHSAQEEKGFASSNGSLLFKNYLDMPVWQLRHLEVSRFIDENCIKTVLDVGCSEGTLINRLSRSYNIEKLIGLDLDQKVLETAKMNVQPEMIQDGISYERKTPLIVELYNINALEPYPLKNFGEVDLVTVIEFIEHISENDLPVLCKNIFEDIQPKFSIITTPNEEFNTHFKFQKGQMRHPEHIFEWKRDRFIEFCEGIKEKYNYSYEVFGVGEHVSDSSHGFCSQGASFKRKSEPTKNEASNNEKTCEPFLQVRYPYWKDRLLLKLENELRNLLNKNNYINPLELLENFKNTKIGKRLKQEITEFSKVQFSDETLSFQISVLDREWIIKLAQNTKYCGYSVERDEVFYEYESSSIEESEKSNYCNEDFEMQDEQDERNQERREKEDPEETHEKFTNVESEN